MSLILIAAISENNVIGNDGDLPWKIPEDLKRFKKLTLNHPVIMGRRTYESIPRRFRPLADRKNIVLSSDFKEGGVYSARTIEEALGFAGEGDAFVAGGFRVYESFLPYVDRMEITRVHEEFEGNVFFPGVNWDEWVLRSRKDEVTEDSLEYSFLSYARAV
ncbi:hypothetical protein CMI42_01560 [Candidatus Pacearchaeota archaeon]|nr:hypothetical protein [Candidatus Pacearchaeota archaeon]|tara:strand:- start:155 stop:637 length:483 start_codon:yes stop_codon:yes gene_type:complete